MRETRAVVAKVAAVSAGLWFAAASGALLAQGAPSAGAGTKVGPVTCREFLHAAGLPFSATRHETNVQTLANGSTVTTRSRTSIARDTRGRVFMATEFLPEPGKAADAEADTEVAKPKILLMALMDPTTESVATWSTGQGSTTVQVMHVRLLGEESRGAPDGTPVPLLEGKTVDGLSAVGYEVTGRIAAGAEGNDQPLVSTQEWWCSPELRLNVLDVRDDPRSGRRTIELTDIVRREPDAALFRLPEGYRVKTVTMGNED